MASCRPSYAMEELSETLLLACEAAGSQFADTGTVRGDPALLDEAQHCLIGHSCSFKLGRRGILACHPRVSLPQNGHIKASLASAFEHVSCHARVKGDARATDTGEESGR